MSRLLNILVSLSFCLTLIQCSSSSKKSTDDENLVDIPAHDDSLTGVDELVEDETQVTQIDELTNQEASQKSVDTDLEKGFAFAEPADIPESSQNMRKSASATVFKQGMYSFDQGCSMKEEPSTDANTAGKISAGKRLWVEPFDSEWHRVYKRSGPVFVPASCL